MENKRSSCLVNFQGRKPVIFNWENQATGNFERFIHADFVTGSRWSHGFTTLSNRKLLGLKVTSV